ncbi:hypothetical protein ACFL34_06240, partial [Candidatus Sumerlaeota bacterium]
MTGPDTSLTLRILAGFNLDLIRQPLTARLAEWGLEPRVELAGFDQWRQELLDPSSPLSSPDLDIAVVFLTEDDVWPGAAEEPELPDMAAAWSRGRQLASELWRVLEQALANFPKPIFLLPTIPPISRSSLGPLEVNLPAARRHVLESFNAALIESAGDQPRVFLLDHAGLAAWEGEKRLIDPRLWFLGRMRFDGAALGSVAAQWASTIAAINGRSRKCLVLDLDNTLWGGVIGEDGLRGIQL